MEKNLPKMELPIWFDGKQINEILLYQTILQQHEIKCINGILYDIDRSIPNDEMEKEILDIIEHYWTSGISAKVTAILSGFKMYTRSDPLPIKEDRVHFRNGTYFVNQKFINQKEFSNCRKTKCIKSNRRCDWSTGTRRRIFTRNRLYGQLVLRTSGRICFTGCLR